MRIQLSPARVEEHHLVSVTLETKMDDVMRCAKDALQMFLFPFAIHSISRRSSSSDGGTKLGDG